MARARYDDEDPRGIGGWLILPTIGLFSAAASGAMSILGVTDALSVIPRVTGAQAAFIVAETTAHIVLWVVGPVVLLTLLFAENVRFPRYFIGWAIVLIAFHVADPLIASALFEQGGGDRRALVRSFLAAFWVPYMLFSRRVKNTFVKIRLLD